MNRRTRRSKTILGIQYSPSGPLSNRHQKMRGESSSDICRYIGYCMQELLSEPDRTCPCEETQNRGKCFEKDCHASSCSHLVFNVGTGNGVNGCCIIMASLCFGVEHVLGEDYYGTPYKRKGLRWSQQTDQLASRLFYSLSLMLSKAKSPPPSITNPRRSVHLPVSKYPNYPLLYAASSLTESECSGRKIRVWCSVMAFLWLTGWLLREKLALLIRV